jgi:hypothetical protein
MRAEEAVLINDSEVKEDTSHYCGKTWPEKGDHPFGAIY